MLSKERFAWVWLTALAVVFALYFTYLAVYADAVAAMHMGQRIGLLALASVYAYYVLMAGIIIVGCVMPFLAGGWTLVHATLLAIAAAEFVHSGLIIHGYRRGVRV